MNLYSINTGNFKLDGGAMFGVVPKSIWNKYNPADNNNLCTWAMRCLLIEDGDRLILVDNGIGDKQDAKFFSHYHLHGDDNLDTSLKKHGFSKSDITDVFLTHLHFDHCGGSISRIGESLVPTFENATYWSNREHWEWATKPNDREKASFLKENILPISESGHLKFTDDLDQPFAPGVDIRIFHGHTQGMMVPLVQYKENIIAFMADLMPSVAHLPLPYIMAYDMFPLTTLQERKSFLNEAVDKNYILFFEHDPFNECCTLKATEKGIREDRTFRLSEL